MREREFGPDLIRAAAAVLVLAVHFFMNIGYFDVPFSGAAMAAGAVIRMAFMTCVPLFMTLTGYLCVNRRWSRGYYRGLLPVLLTYLLAGVICLAYRIGALGAQISAAGAVRQLLDFSAAPYGWYVEMYVGLFLLSPFLNAAWHALEEKARRALLITLAVMTALPPLVNLAGQILPDWWAGIYPLTYYFAGAWLRERPLRAKSGWLLAGWLVPAAVAGVGQYLMQGLLMPGAPFRVRGANYWASLITLVETVCLFSLLGRCGGSRTPGPVRRWVSRAAALSLPLYLVSYVTDQIIYPVLNAAVPQVTARLPFLPLMVLVSLLLSGVMAQLIDWAAKALLKLLPAKERVLFNAANAQCRNTKES